MNVQCQLKACKAIRPLSEMRRYRGKKRDHFRCRHHSAAFLSEIVGSKVWSVVTCIRCRTKRPRVEVKKYGGGFKCTDQIKCDKNSSSTTSI